MVEPDSSRTVRAALDGRTARRGSRALSAPGSDSNTSGGCITSASPPIPMPTGPAELTSNRGVNGGHTARRRRRRAAAPVSPGEDGARAAARLMNLAGLITTRRE
jgi:hypothetical protein